MDKVISYSFTVSTRTVSKVLLVFILDSSLYFSAGFITLIYAAGIAFGLFLNRFKINKSYFILMIPFFALFLLGSYGFISHLEMDAIKDAWYLFKIVLALSVGYIFMSHIKTFKELSEIIILASILASLIHLTQAFIYMINGVSLFELRNKYGIVGGLVPSIGLALLISHHRHSNMRRVLYILALVVCASSLIASMSRTYIGVFIIMYIALQGFSVFRVKTLALFASVFILVGVLISYNGIESRTLFTKFEDSISEIELSNYSSMTSIYSHWRGYESYRALIQYEKVSLFQKIFGQGFGAKVDLGAFFLLGGNEIRLAPILHNGYLYILTKYGIAGLIIFLIFIVLMIANSSDSSLIKTQDYVDIRNFLSGLGWIVLFTTLVITGIFNKFVLDCVLIMIGASYRIYNKSLREMTYQNFISLVKLHFTNE